MLIGVVSLLASRVATTSAESGFHVRLPVGGPGLAAGAPIWAERRTDLAVNIRRADRQTHAIRTILSVPRNYYFQFARIAGSASTLAVEVISGGKPPNCFSSWCFRDVLAGGPTGPLRSLESGCPLNDVAQAPRTLDVSDRTVVYFDCAKNLVDITDMDTGHTVQVPGNNRGLRIAGRYVAWVDGSVSDTNDAVTVYDWKAHAPVYTIPRAMTRGAVADLDLRSDGTLAVETPNGHQQAQLNWASIGSPRLHRIPVAARDLYAIRFVAGKIAFERGKQAIIIPRADVGVTDLAGHVKLLGRGAFMGDDRPFDFDGKRIAWYAFACTGARMHVQPIDSAVVHESMTRCALRFERQPRIRQDRFVDLAVDCYGYAEGCAGRNASLRLRHKPYAVVGHGKDAHSIKLTDRGVELLKEHGKLRLSARITMTDVVGTRERRSGAVTLTRP